MELVPACVDERQERGCALTRRCRGMGNWATGWAIGAAARAIRRSFVQDALDGAGAATALHGAAKAAVDLVRGQRLRSRSRYHVPYLVVAKHIA
jgi:hypothetical protein